MHRRKAMSIPIIVVRYKQPELEARCIAAVHEHTPPGLGHLVEVDNGHLNESLSVVWNRAIQQQCMDCDRSEYAVLLNTDCFVSKGWLNKLLRVIESNQRLAFVGPMTNNCGSLQKAPPGYDPTKCEGQVATSLTHPGLHISGFCLLVRVQAWHEVGGFDEAAPLYGQESWLIDQGWKRGWHTAIALDCWVEHLAGASFKAAEARGELDWDEEKRKGARWFRGKLNQTQ